jgi:hypothetical protein
MRLALFLTAALAIVNGIFSPMWIVVFALQGLWLPSFMPAGLWFPVTLSVVLLAAFYMLLSGLPAALYERLVVPGPTLATRVIWLAAMALITWPSLPNIAAALGWR